MGGGAQDHVSSPWLITDKSLGNTYIGRKSYNSIVKYTNITNVLVRVGQIDYCRCDIKISTSEAKNVANLFYDIYEGNEVKSHTNIAFVIFKVVAILMAPPVHRSVKIYCRPTYWLNIFEQSFSICLFASVANCSY